MQNGGLNKFWSSRKAHAFVVWRQTGRNRNTM